MTHRPLPAAVRSQIATRLAAALADRSCREVAAIVGCDHSTVSRRGAEPAAWPLDDALRLALADQALADALLAALTGATAPTGEAVRLLGDLVDELRSLGDSTAAIAQAMADGRVTAAEARDVLGLIERRRALEDERLIPDLRAVLEARP